MNGSDLEQTIEQRVSSFNPKKYSVWTIGVTDDPGERKKTHDSDGQDTQYWKHWEADSETIARAVEKYFLGKGMKGGTGGGKNPRYVYIF